MHLWICVLPPNHTGQFFVIKISLFFWWCSKQGSVVGISLLAASPKITTQRLLINHESLAFSVGLPQLALINQINLLLLIYVLPHPILHFVCLIWSTSGWHLPAHLRFFSSFSLSLPRSPTYSFLPGYWPFSFLFHQSHWCIFTQCKQNFHNRVSVRWPAWPWTHRNLPPEYWT